MQFRGLDAVFRQHLQNRLQPGLNVPQATAHVVAKRRLHQLGRADILGAAIFILGVAILIQTPPGARERQAFIEDELLDPEDQLDIRSAIEARAAAGRHLSDLRELGFPRPQNVGLDLHHFADVRSLE